MMQGYVPLRRGLLEHLDRGRLGSFDVGIYIRILLQADYRTGLWWGSANKLRAQGPADPSLRGVQRSLEHLERITFIRRFRLRGKHGNYPVLIHKFLVTDGALKGMRLNAERSADWRHPVYEAWTEDSAEWRPISDVSLNGTHLSVRESTDSRQSLGDTCDETTPSQEERIENKKETIVSQDDRALLKKQAAVNARPGTDDFLHQLAENFPEVSPERLRWVVYLVAARAKTPPISAAYFRKALPRVFENLQGETDTWLSVEAAKRLLEFPGLGLPDLAQDLKQLAADNNLPYGSENVTIAIDTGLRRVEEERELQSELAVGRGPGARK